MKPLYITLEKSEMPILIIDREGSIGIGLYSKFKDLSQVVLVGGKKPDVNTNLLFLSYKNDIPQIPGDVYSQIFYIVHSSRELEEIFSALSKKAIEDKAKFFIVGERDLIPLHVLQTIFSNNEDCAVVILGDIFGNPLNHRKLNLIEKIFEEAKVKKAIKLPGVGLSKIYPVFFDDAVIELVRLSFTFNKKIRLYFLHTQYPITVLGLSHMLQKESPLLKIDFEKDEKPAENDSIPIEGEYLLPQDYPATEKLLKTYKASVKKETGSQLDNQFIEITKLKMESQNKNRRVFYFVRNFFLYTIVFLVAIFILPPISALTLFFMGQNSLQYSLKDLENGKIESAKNQLKISASSFNSVKNILPILSWEGSLIGKGDVTGVSENITIAMDGITDLNKLFQVSDSVKNIVSEKSSKLSGSLLDLTASIKNLILTVEQISNNRSIPNSVKKKITGMAQNIRPFANVIESLPEVLGKETKKTYLILLQNNAELRPGGGFIGSYAVLTVDKGMIVDFSIHDVYDADGQLRGHVEPPFAIRRYLSSVHLYLRDSNFDVDFTKSAFLAAFMYQQETHQKVDGVIGIDLSFIKEIIGAAGQIYLPTYNLTITEDNFFMQAENHSEKNFFPGSSQKQAFLNETFKSLQDKFITGKGINYLQMLEAISTAAKEKNLIFAFADSNIQDLFTVNGFSSSLWDNRKEEEQTVNDFFGINEANLGVNKVNYYIARKVRQNVTIENDGSIQEQATLDFTNSSTGQWPGGIYKVFLRFILPKDSILAKVTIDEVEQKIVPAITNPLQYEAPNFLPPTGLEVEREDEAGKTIYGFLALVPPSKNQSITIFYQLSKKTEVNLPKNIYDLKYFKQPGTDIYPFLFSINIPSSDKPIKKISMGELKDSQTVFNSNLDSDFDFHFTFAKK